MMHPVVEHLDALERIARGFGPSRLARAEWWLQTAKIGANAEDWPTTWDRLQRLGDVLLEGAPKEAWNHFVAALLFTALDGNLPSRVRSIFAYQHVMQRPAKPHLDVLRKICDPTRHDSQARLDIARALADIFPSWAAPHQTLAWIYERRQNWINAADAYRNAARIAPDNATFHALAGIALARAGRYSEAKPLLRALPAHEVPTYMLSWWALALMNSPFYLDRYRVYDTMQDCVEAARQARVGARLELDDAIRAAVAVIESAPSVIGDDEADRLLHLLNIAWPKNHALLAARIAERHARSKISDLVLKTTSPDTLGFPARAFAQVLRDLTRTPDDAEHPCVGCIAALKHQTPMLDVFVRVEKALKNTPSDTWTPWVVFWLELPAEMDEVAARRLTSLIQTWALKSPEPSCGWWTLSRFLAGRGWIEAAYACAEQARLMGTKPDSYALELIPHLLEYTIETNDDRRLREWLEFTVAAYPSVGGSDGT